MSGWRDAPDRPVTRTVPRDSAAAAHHGAADDASASTSKRAARGTPASTRTAGALARRRQPEGAQHLDRGVQVADRHDLPDQGQRQPAAARGGEQERGRELARGARGDRDVVPRPRPRDHAQGSRGLADRVGPEGASARAGGRGAAGPGGRGARSASVRAPVGPRPRERRRDPEPGRVEPEVGADPVPGGPERPRREPRPDVARRAGRRSPRSRRALRRTGRRPRPRRPPTTISVAPSACTASARARWSSDLLGGTDTTAAQGPGAGRTRWFVTRGRYHPGPCSLASGPGSGASSAVGRIPAPPEDAPDGRDRRPRPDHRDPPRRAEAAPPRQGPRRLRPRRARC